MSGAANIWTPLPRLARKALRAFLFFLPEQVADSVIFEARAFVGRLFARSLALDPLSRNFINLGSGPFLVPGCINIDFFGVPGIEYGADLRRPLKVADSTADGIFSEHTIEHLTYAESGRLLRECHRIMKPGGVIRIVLPVIWESAVAACPAYLMRTSASERAR